MRHVGRTIAMIAGAIAVSTASLSGALAQYPAGPVKIVVALPPGGSSDLTARLLATHLGESFKQTVIVENRVGANGLIGMTAVAKSKPDGLTLLFGVPSVTTVRALVKNAAIDPVKDLDGISQVVESVFVVAISSKLPAKTYSEFIAYAKANPGKLNFGTYAAGNRLIAELFNQLHGLKMAHVAYKGENFGVAALAAGEVHMVIGTAVTMKEKVAQGTIRTILVSGDQRAPALPDVPSAKDVGLKGFDPVLWFGLHAPAGTPAAVKNRLAAEVAAFVQKPDVRKRLDGFGLSGKASTPEAFSAFLAKDAAQWVDVAKVAGIEPQ